MSLESLFSPISIGSLNVENRIVMPPMATNYASTEGYVTDKQIDYYVERAKGGVGYITVEHTGIMAQGKASPKMLLISTDTHASYFKKLVDSIHEVGGKVFIQINHVITIEKPVFRLILDLRNNIPNWLICYANVQCFCL